MKREWRPGRWTIEIWAERPWIYLGIGMDAQKEPGFFRFTIAVLCVGIDARWSA